MLCLRTRGHAGEVGREALHPIYHLVKDANEVIIFTQTIANITIEIVEGTMIVALVKTDIDPGAGEVTTAKALVVILAAAGAEACPVVDPRRHFHQVKMKVEEVEIIVIIRMTLDLVRFRVLAPHHIRVPAHHCRTPLWKIGSTEKAK